MYIPRELGLYITTYTQGAPGRKGLPVQELQETWFQPLGQEDPLEEEMAIHFSILAWKIPWIEEHGSL